MRISDWSSDVCSSDLARLGADAADHLRDRMHDIAVAGAAEIGEAAGDGQAARIVLGYPYLLAADLDRRGEAGIEVEEAHVADRFAGHVERPARAVADGVRDVQFRPLGQEPVVVAVGAAVTIDPLRLGTAESSAERRGGKGCVHTDSSRWRPEP